VIEFRKADQILSKVRERVNFCIGTNGSNHGNDETMGSDG